MENLFFRVLVVSAAVSAVLLPLLALLPRWQRRYAAHTRKAVWLAVALVLLVVPLLPKNRAPIQLSAPQSAVTFPTIRAETPQAGTTQTGPPQGTVQSGNAAILPPVTGQSPGLPNTTTPQTPSVDGDTPTLPVTTAQPTRTIRWTALFSTLWLAGMAAILLWHLAAYLIARHKLMGRVVPAEDHAALTAEICPRRTVRFFRVDGLETPMTLGLLRPVVLLPAGIVPQAAIRHELIHIRRWDVGYKALLLLACAVHWFDPLVWLMARRAGRDVEASCDAAVVAGGDAEALREYGALLLRSAARKNVPFTTQFGSSKNQMKSRLYDLFHPGKRSRVLVGAILLVCLTAGSLVACQTGGQTTGEDLDHPAQGNDLDPEPSETPAPAKNEAPVKTPKMTAEVAEAFRAVLLGEAEFICVYTSGEQKQLNLTHFENGYIAKQIAIVDLDADGVPEVAVRLSNNDSILLNCQDGVTYGYYRPVRWFNTFNLKTDGSADYSSSASDWGYHTLSFTADGIVENRLLYCQSNPVKDPEPTGPFTYESYIVDGMEVTEEEFKSAVAAQNAKPDVVWYDIGDAAQMLYEATVRDEPVERSHYRELFAPRAGVSTPRSLYYDVRFYQDTVNRMVLTIEDADSGAVRQELTYEYSTDFLPQGEWTGVDWEDYNGDGYNDLLIQVGIHASGRTQKYVCYVFDETQGQYVFVDGFDALTFVRYMPRRNAFLVDSLPMEYPASYTKYEIRGTELVETAKLSWIASEQYGAIFTEEQWIDGELVTVHDYALAGEIDLDAWGNQLGLWDSFSNHYSHWNNPTARATSVGPLDEVDPIFPPNGAVTPETADLWAGDDGRTAFTVDPANGRCFTITVTNYGSEQIRLSVELRLDYYDYFLEARSTWIPAGETVTRTFMIAEGCQFPFRIYPTVRTQDGGVAANATVSVVQFDA